MPRPDRDAVLVAACRTPIGTAGRGSLATVPAGDLAHATLAELLRRAPVPDVEDVLLGEGLQGGGVLARHVALRLGLDRVPGLALNRHCASSLTATGLAAATVRAGMADVLVAGGTESISTMPSVGRRDVATGDWVDATPLTHPETADAPALDMTVTIGWNTARAAGLTRAELDGWAYRSHTRAVAAIDRGDLAEETFAVRVEHPGGCTTEFTVDEHPRRDTSLERLAALRPLHPEIDGFSVTAGNMSGSNDGAAAVLVTSRGYARSRGLPVLATVRSWAAVAVPPVETGLAPVTAIPRALALAGMTVADVDLWEINEAHAAVPLAACRALGLPEDAVNVSGSGCSLGHPVSATGARMIVTLVHELGRRGGGVAVASMCAGGGMGAAAVLEVEPRPTPPGP